MFTKKIDQLGRIVIPKDLRKKLGIEIGDNLELNLSGDTIEIKRCYKVVSHYYKIINTNTKETEFFLISPKPLVTNKICSFFEFEDCEALSISESEYKALNTI